METTETLTNYGSFTNDDFARLGKCVKVYRESATADLADFYRSVGMPTLLAAAFELGHISGQPDVRGDATADNPAIPVAIVPYLSAIEDKLDWIDGTCTKILKGELYFTDVLGPRHTPEDSFGPWASPAVDLPQVTEKDAADDLEKLYREKVLGLVEDYRQAATLIGRIASTSDDATQHGQEAKNLVSAAFCNALLSF
jgi:hypothetical protein